MNCIRLTFFKSRTVHCVSINLPSFREHSGYWLTRDVKKSKLVVRRYISQLRPLFSAGDVPAWWFYVEPWHRDHPTLRNIMVDPSTISHKKKSANLVRFMVILEVMLSHVISFFKVKWSFEFIYAEIHPPFLASNVHCKGLVHVKILGTKKSELFTIS